MKTSRVKNGVVAIMVMMMVGVMSVQAQNRRGPRPQQQGQEQMERGERGSERQGPPEIPGMTTEQKEQMKAIHLETEKAALPVKNQIGEKEARLRTLVTADSYDEKSVNRLLDEIGDLKTQVEKLKVGSIQKVKGVLNEDQLLVFYKHMEKKGDRGGKGPRGR